MSWAKSLVKLTAYEVELLQKRLSDVVERRSAIETVLQALDMEEALEAAHALGDAEAGFYLIGFREGLKVRRAKANAELKAIAAEERGCRDALSESFEAQKKYEQVVDADARVRARALAARETVEMDAAALRRAAVKSAA